MKTVIWYLKKLERNLRRRENKKAVLWLLKIMLFVFTIFMGGFFSNEAGWWGWIVFGIVFIMVNKLIDKRIDYLNKQHFLTKFPFLADLKYGQLITVELKNGEELKNRVFNTILSSDILVGAEPVFNKDPEDMLKGFKKTRWISLRKVKAIRVELD